MLDRAWLREVRDRAMRDQSLCPNDHVVRREDTGDGGTVFTVSCGTADLESFQVPFGTIDSQVQARLRNIADAELCVEGRA